MKHKFEVTLTIPPGCTPGDMIEYISQEVRAGIGCLPLTDPLHDLDRDSVSVRYIPNEPVVQGVRRFITDGDNYPIDVTSFGD